MEDTSFPIPPIVALKALHQYLVQKGWLIREHPNRVFKIYYKKHYQLVVPNEDNQIDINSFIDETLTQLEKIEKRKGKEILDEIKKF